VTELKPCPAGHKEVTIWMDESQFAKTSYVVFCHGTPVEPCGWRVKRDTEAEAIKAWNTRADDWQPIETAPKDGTIILVAVDVPGLVRMVRWASGGMYGVGCWANFPQRGNGGIGPIVLMVPPTRWQPLPQPPQEKD